MSKSVSWKLTPFRYNMDYTKGIENIFTEDLFIQWQNIKHKEECVVKTYVC